MISVVIPVYKKTEEFLVNLEQNYPLMKGCEIIVVNDDPTSSIKYRLFPKGESPFGRKKYNLRLIENPKNLGFSGAMNEGVKMAKNNYVFLLNSDVTLNNSSFQSAIKKFEQNDRLFAVTFAQKEKDGSVVGKNKTFWRRGLIHHSKADNLNAGNTGWAEGGSTIIRKDMFIQLNGFDTVYAPFYWEDIDLSYRAKKQGYEVLFDPAVLVNHRHESTIGSFWSPRAIRTISYRNQLLMSWKHIEDTNIISHIAYLTFHLVKSVIKGDTAFILGFLQAFPYLLSPKFYKIR